MEAKEIKLTFKCTIVTYNQQQIKDADLMGIITAAIEGKIVLKGLIGNQELRLEGLTG